MRCASHLIVHLCVGLCLLGGQPGVAGPLSSTAHKLPKGAIARLGNDILPSWLALFVPGTKSIALSDDAYVRFLDIETGREGEPLRCPVRGKPVLGVSPNGRLLAAGCGANLRIWDLTTKKILHDIRPGFMVRALAFAPDGSAVAAAGSQTWFGLFDTTSGKRTTINTRHESFIHGLAFSRDGRRLASACEDGAVIVTDVTT